MNISSSAMQQSRWRSWLALACTAIMLSSCASREGTLPGSTSPGPTVAAPSPSLAPTPTEPPFRFPLTGLPSETEAIGRPFLVMVENSPQARPQTGLNQADLVFEILAEGDITRFVAVYHSKEATAIGPVRSIRPYFVQLGDMLDAVIVHAGWSQDAMNLLNSRKLNHLDQVYGDHAYYWRATDRKAPHNLYTSVEKMRQGSIDRKFRTEWKMPKIDFAKSGKSLLSGEAGRHIEIPYLSGYKAAYDYDSESGLYKRTMADKPHLDKETGEQLSAVNLLVLEAPHKILDKEGRRSVDISGPGKGVILQQGKSQEVRWEQKDGMLRTYVSNQEVPLLPGNTWIQIVPTGTQLKLE